MGRRLDGAEGNLLRGEVAAEDAEDAKGGVPLRNYRRHSERSEESSERDDRQVWTQIQMDSLLRSE
jgi:hypothetical protein